MSLESTLVSDHKLTLAVHKFSSCDGCQLAFLNAGEALLELAQHVEFKHFAEAGFLDEHAQVDVAFVEGSISTEEEEKRIKAVRANSKYVISIGACATAGGIQALRNTADTGLWVSQVYADAQFISVLNTASAIKQHIRVDFELWGCPITQRQLMLAIRALRSRVAPRLDYSKVCLECKRQLNPCVMVTSKTVCLGPITNTGCGAICPHVGRGCYGCFGPSENANASAMRKYMSGIGMIEQDIKNKLAFIYSNDAAMGKRS